MEKKKCGKTKIYKLEDEDFPNALLGSVQHSDILGYNNNHHKVENKKKRKELVDICDK